MRSVWLATSQAFFLLRDIVTGHTRVVSFQTVSTLSVQSEVFFNFLKTKLPSVVTYKFAVYIS